MWYDIPGRVEEWHIPRKTASKRVRYRSQTQTVERLSARHQAVLATFLGFRKPLYSCTEEMCHSFPPSKYVIHRDSVLPGLPPLFVLQVTNAGARRPGYEAKAGIHYKCSSNSFRN